MVVQYGNWRWLSLAEVTDKVHLRGSIFRSRFIYLAIKEHIWISHRRTIVKILGWFMGEEDNTKLVFTNNIQSGMD